MSDRTGKSPKRITDPETGKQRLWREGDPEPREKAGRPRTVGPKPKAAPRIEGQSPDQYVDRTGRKNPGAFVKGSVPVKPHINKQMKAVVQQFGVEAIIPRFMEKFLDENTSDGVFYKIGELLLAHGFGRPAQTIDVEMGVRSEGLNEAIRRLDAMDAVPAFVVPSVDETRVAALIGLAEVIQEEAENANREDE